MLEMQREGGGRRPSCEEVGLSDLQSVNACENLTTFHPHLQVQKRICEQKTDSPTCATPTLMDASEVTLLGRVDNERAASRIYSCWQEK